MPIRVELSIVGQWIQTNNRLLDQATVTCEKKNVGARSECGGRIEQLYNGSHALGRQVVKTPHGTWCNEEWERTLLVTTSCRLDWMQKFDVELEQVFAYKMS